MAFSLPPLPFDPNALAPHMSAETFEFHHGKHHKAYVDKLNTFIDDKGLVGLTLVQAVEKGANEKDAPLFNQAAQIWNHTFFWHCLSPSSGAPTGKLAELITRDFGSFDTLKEKLAAEAVAHFASGWAWLVLDGDKLQVTSYHDADTPIVHGKKPLLTLDVWEHAYYIDHRNARPAYAKAVLDNIVNWDFVAQNLDGEGASRADQTQV